jgi:hypothetical protein
MNFVKFVLSQKGSYSYVEASNTQMGDLGMFLAHDFDCSWSSFREWAINDAWGDCVSGNITCLEKDNEYILLSDLYSEEAQPLKLKIPREQFINVLDTWCNKIIAKQPKNVIIKYDNNQFTIETNP